MLKKLRLLILALCLATPQKSEAVIGWATGLFVTGLTYCVSTYITRHNNVSHFVTNQDSIMRYISYVYVYPGKHYRQKTTTVIETSNPESMIAKINEFVTIHANEKYSLRIQPAVMLEDGTIVQLKKIRVNAGNIKKLNKRLHARLFVSDSALHLTYRTQLALGAIPTVVGGGPFALLLPAVLII